MIQLTSELLSVTVGGGASAQPDAKDLLKDYEAGDIVMAYFEKDNTFQPAEARAPSQWLQCSASPSQLLEARLLEARHQRYAVRKCRH